MALQKVAHDNEKIIYELTQTPIKKFRTDQYNWEHGGSLAWTLDIVQLIINILVHGNPRTSIVPLILSCSSILNKSTEVHELPDVNFIQVYRTYIHNLCTILSAYQLSKAK